MVGVLEGVLVIVGAYDGVDVKDGVRVSVPIAMSGLGRVSRG